MNRFKRNKDIVNICKNYYTIVGSEISEKDKVTSKIVRMYSEYVFSLDIVTKREVEKLEHIDNIMLKFVSDFKFRKELCNHFLTIRVSKAVNNIVEYVINKIIEFSEDYKDIYTRNIYIPRWI